MKHVRALSLVAGFLASAALSSTASANNYFVDNENDSGVGSLRQAILDANQNPGFDEIAFRRPNMTVAPETELPTITDSVAIWGNVPSIIKASHMTQIGNDLSLLRVQAPSNRVIDVALIDLELYGETSHGGVRGLNVNGANANVAISNLGFVACGRASNALTQFVPRGGAIASTQSDVTILASQFFNNFADEGGAIYIEKGSLSVTNAEFADNAATGGGGAIALKHGTHNLDRITANNNTAAGLGGGGGLRIEGSTAAVAIVNSTFSANRSTKYGGGNIAQLGGSLTLDQVTIAFGSDPSGYNGDSIYARSTQPILARNSILHSGTARACDLGVPLVIAAKNISTDPFCGASITENPALGPLGWNGGLQPTHPITTTSRAHRAGDTTTCRPTSQNGVPRSVPPVQCELGAFEIP